MHPQAVDNLKPSLQGRRILLGITGSIAAFKACDIVRGLRECGAEVRCVLTESAERFVTRLTLENLSGNRVYADLWAQETFGTHHIDAARWAELVLVAPATANTLAKLAQGLADDLLSTELLAYRGPLLIAPAMNPAMFAHPAVQANLKLLETRGARVLGPAHGVTSCGEEGLGRMLEPDALIEGVAQALYQPARGKKLVVTLGPTRSALDPVRYLTNRSSGQMGAAIAWAARRKGYAVTAIAGPCDALLPADAEVVRVHTAEQMLEASVRAFADADVFVAAAAVLDWEVRTPSGHKLKKENGAPALDLTPAPDVLATITARKRKGQYVLGFAAETQATADEGARKRARKGCDALFANDVSLPDRGFETRLNAGWWIDETTVQELPLVPKAELAQALLGRIEESIARGLRRAAPEAARPEDQARHSGEAPA